MNNVEAMFKMYRNAHPELNRDECWELMKEKESNFLGLDMPDSEMKELIRKENIRKGTYFKKRKKGRK